MSEEFALDEAPQGPPVLAPSLSESNLRAEASAGGRVGRGRSLNKGVRKELRRLARLEAAAEEEEGAGVDEGATLRQATVVGMGFGALPTRGEDKMAGMVPSPRRGAALAAAAAAADPAPSPSAADAVSQPLRPQTADDGHAPSAQGGGLVADVLSGLILTVLAFAFANVFALLIFEGRLEAYAPVGMAMHLCSTAVAAFATARWGGCAVAVAAPDINPTVFFTAAAVTIDGSVSDERDALATVLFTVVLGTAMVAAAFYLLGRFRLSRLVQFMPASVLAGFLACVGFAVVREAIVVATGEHFTLSHIGTIFGTWQSWKLILPALPIGFPLYFAKRLHVGRPTVYIPFFLVVPLALFYAVLAASGTSVEEARDSGWFFPSVERSTFYEQWSLVLGNLGGVDFAAVAEALPGLMAMVLICTMDFLLKLAGTEKLLAVELDYDNEMRLAGLFNFCNVAAASVPAYGQMKLNVLNAGIIGNTVSRRAGYITAAASAVLFLAGVPIINVLPRFFLAGLLLFAGLGLLIENLWDTRRVLSRLEWAVVWVTLVVFFFYGLLLAVAIGVFLSVALFAYQYGKLSDIKGKLRGAELHSRMVRPLVHRRKIEQLGDDSAVCLLLHGMLFFGSASTVLAHVDEQLRADAARPRWRRTRYVIIDFVHVIGIDSSAVSVFTKVVRRCRGAGLRLLLTGMSPSVRVHLEDEGALDGARDHTSSRLRRLLIEKRERKHRGIFSRRSRSSDDDSPSPDGSGSGSGTDADPDADADAGGGLAAVADSSDDESDCAAEDAEDDFVAASGVARRSSSAVFVHIFDGLDDSSLWTEEHVLHRANRLRGKWLFTPYARKLHSLASHKALSGPFNRLFGAVERGVWSYFRQERVPAGTVICRPGAIVDRLYLLTSGRVSKHVEEPGDGGRSVRVVTFTVGCANSGMLDLPCAETVVADEDCQFVTIGREEVARLAAERPTLAAELQQAVLHSLVTSRNHLERELNKRHTWNAFDLCMERGERSALSVSAVVTRLARAVERLARGAGAEPAAAAGPDSSSLGRAMYPDAGRAGGGASGGGGGGGGGGGEEAASSSVVLAMYPDAVERTSLRLPEAARRGPAMEPPSLARAASEASCVHRLPERQRERIAAYFRAHTDGGGRMPLKNVRHSVLDLGYYETAEEMRRLLAIVEAEDDDGPGVSEERFVDLVGRVAMVDLDARQVAAYRAVFSKFADPHSGDQLDSFALARLFETSSGYRIQQARLSELVAEWGDGTDSLSFESFVALIAFSIKREHLEEGVEAEFERLSEPASGDLPRRVTPASLAAALRREVPGCEPTEHEVREMVYEADKSGRGWVSLADYKDEVTVVYRPATILMWDWHTRRARQFTHDQFVDGEFDGLDDR